MAMTATNFCGKSTPCAWTATYNTPEVFHNCADITITAGTVTNPTPVPSPSPIVSGGTGGLLLLVLVPPACN
jgi:hypothetical protein